MKKQLSKALAFLSISSFILSASISVEASVLKSGSRGNEVIMLQDSLKKLGHFSYHTSTGYFGDTTANAVKSYQNSKKIEVMGIVDDNLFKQIINESGINTLYRGDLDWFSKVSNIFYRGCDAVVIDVDTGKSFKVRRTFGTNHADVEPLTKEDSQIIKSIWGGKWSWERRAVVVKVGDTYIAGSMTAFPHAGVDSQPAVKLVSGRSGGYGKGQNLDAVKNNGVDGHMDIHFLNSKTHGTNVMQKSHQDMVKKSAKFIENNYN